MEPGRVYVRFRGRVTGPFAEAEVRRMVERGQVSRMHELSNDRSSWRRAGQVASLFGGHGTNEPPTGTSASAAEEVTGPASGDSAHGIDAGADAGAGESSDAGREVVWYYALDGREVGPVSEGTIRRLAAGGGLTADTLVWCEGMADWTTLGQTELEDELA